MSASLKGDIRDQGSTIRSLKATYNEVLESVLDWRATLRVAKVGIRKPDYQIRNLERGIILQQGQKSIQGIAEVVIAHGELHESSQTEDGRIEGNVVQVEVCQSGGECLEWIRS